MIAHERESPVAHELHYRVRVSSRARRASITLSVHDGVTVVVPRRFPRSEIAALVTDRIEWIERAADRLGLAPDLLTRPPPATALPTQIDLAALGAQWTVSYEFDATLDSRVYDSGRGHLAVSAADVSTALAALRRWVTRVARRSLEPQLRELADQRTLVVQAVSIRSQRTLWASCSATANISLNRALLFLRPELVRYVMLHELCHIEEMNHSAHFWRLLELEEPRSVELRRQLQDAWSEVPAWAH